MDALLKRFLLLSLLAFARLVAAQEVVLFIDTNENARERLAARAAVAARNAARTDGGYEVFVEIAAEGVKRYSGETVETVANPGTTLPSPKGGRSETLFAFGKQLTPAQQSRLEQINRDIADKAKEFLGVPGDTPAYNRLVSEMQSLKQQQGALLSEGQVNKASIEMTLAKLKEDGQAVSTLVVSGHHATRNYFGSVGHLSQREIGEAFAAHDEPGGHNRSVKGMVIPACYGCTVGSSSIEWGSVPKGDGSGEEVEVFPERIATMGYDESAPLGHEVSGQRYIHDTLVKERRLREMLEAGVSMDEIEDHLQKMATAVSDIATICLSGDAYKGADCDQFWEENSEYNEILFKDGKVSCINAMEECLKIYEELKHSENYWLSYYEGRNVCKSDNPPESCRDPEKIPPDYDYSNPPSKFRKGEYGKYRELRKYYANANIFLSCAFIKDEDGNPIFDSGIIPNTSTVISMIYHDTIMDNFFALHAGDIAENIKDLEGLLQSDKAWLANAKKRGMDPELLAQMEAANGQLEYAIDHLKRVVKHTKENRTATRERVVEATKALEYWYAFHQDDPSKRYEQDNKANQHAAFFVAGGLRDHVVDYNPGCVPGNWLENNTSSTRERTRCEARLRIGKRAQTSDRGKAHRRNSKVFEVRRLQGEASKRHIALQDELKAYQRELGSNPSPKERARLVLLEAQLENASRDIRRWDLEMAIAKTRAKYEEPRASQARASEIAELEKMKAEAEGSRVIDILLSEPNPEIRTILATEYLRKPAGEDASVQIARLQTQSSQLRSQLTEQIKAKKNFQSWSDYLKAINEEPFASDGTLRSRDEIIGSVPEQDRASFEQAWKYYESGSETLIAKIEANDRQIQTLKELSQTNTAAEIALREYLAVLGREAPASEVAAAASEVADVGAKQVDQLAEVVQQRVESGPVQDTAALRRHCRWNRGDQICKDLADQRALANNGSGDR